MDLVPKLSSLAAVFVAFTGLAAASSFVTDDVSVSHGSGRRSLLQAKTPCPLNIEFMNYTIITSKCKGPRYPRELCCGAFKELACPYAAELNDLANNCASTLFNYINLLNNYPPGLFANECTESKEGLACPAMAPQPSNDISGSRLKRSLNSVIFLVCAIVLGFLIS